MHECHSNFTHSDGVGAHAMDVQVGELVRRYWAPWRHGPGPAAERVDARDPRAFGLLSAGLVLLGPHLGSWHRRSLGGYKKMLS